MSTKTLNRPAGSRELFRLLRLEWSLLRRLPAFWLLTVGSTWLVPLLISNVLLHEAPQKWGSFFQAQMLCVFFVLPVLISLTWNEEIERFVPNVVLTKMRDQRLFWMAKGLLFWLWVSASILGADFVLAVVQQLRIGSGPWSLVLAFAVAALATQAYYVQLALLLCLLMRRAFYTVMILIVYLFASMQIQQPLISLWLPPEQILRALQSQDAWLFWTGRGLHFAGGVLLLWVTSNLFRRRASQ
jgi:hypothetical protein